MSASSRFSRRQVISTIMDMLEDGTSARRVAQLLASYLISTGQTRNIELYLRDIELAAMHRFGIATAYVSTARQLSTAARRQVEQLIKSNTSAQTVELVTQTDPSLIGGIVIKTADAELDNSVRTKLQNLRSI